VIAIFFLCVVLMVGAALLFVLPPLLRQRTSHANPGAETRRLLDALNAARTSGILSEVEYAAKRAELGDRLLAAIDAPVSVAASSRTSFYVALGVALLLPATAILLYRAIGEPRALDPAALVASDTQAPADHSQDMQQAITNLAAKLKQNPDDAEGWTLLGRAYEATQRFAEARDALKHAHDLSANDPDVTVAYAEALALASDSRRIDGEPRQLIDAALKVAPDNQRGLWLLGISDYQAKKYDAAITTWKHLLTVLPKDSDVAGSVQNQIAQAEAERDGRAPPAEEETTASAAEAPITSAPAIADGPHLTVEVALDPKLKDKLAPGDVLFVYAKAANGPPMPLAIQRTTADKLPLTVTLTDGMGMLPNMKLSNFPQIIIGARVSKSGNALPQSGDLQTVSQPLAVTTTTPIKLTIDQVVP
jgi:cytochrome c-type biogenesis protein CcmH